jgi:hypothetical protein
LDAGGLCARTGESVARIAALVRGWRVDTHVGQGPVAAALVDQLALVASDLQVAADELADIARRCRQLAADPERDGR